MGKIQKENEKENKLKPVNIKVKTKNGETVIIHFGRSDKLGNKIVHFSLPRVITCPGRTRWCEVFCYAAYGRHIFPSVKKARIENYELTKRDDFTKIMVAAIKKLREKGFEILRLHEEGDFYDKVYIEKWIEIARRLKENKVNVIIYAYTKSWRVKELLPYLEELKKNENVVLIASTDSFSGSPPEGWKEAGIEFCYNQPAILCPHDAGKVPSCSDCLLCVRAHVNVYFKAKYTN